MSALLFFCGFPELFTSLYIRMSSGSAAIRDVLVYGVSVSVEYDFSWVEINNVAQRDSARRPPL